MCSGLCKGKCSMALEQERGGEMHLCFSTKEAERGFAYVACVQLRVEQ